MIAGLGEVLTDAKKDNRAIAGLVCLGWEDMRAYVKAAELENQPVIIPVSYTHLTLPTSYAV